MSSIIIIVSILLDGIFNYLFPNSIISSLFCIVSLITLYKINNKNRFLIISTIYGFIYDLFFTNFYILNAMVFFLVSYFIIIFFKKFKYTFINLILLNVIVIIIYLLIIIIIFNITSYSNYSLSELLFVVPRFLLINTIYEVVIYLIVIKRNNKHIFT